MPCSHRDFQMTQKPKADKFEIFSDGNPACFRIGKGGRGGKGLFLLQDIEEI